MVYIPTDKKEIKRGVDRVILIETVAKPHRLTDGESTISVEESYDIGIYDNE